MPDMDTFSEIPWQPCSGMRGTARVICDVFTRRGQPFAGDPRYGRGVAVRDGRGDDRVEGDP
jgi:glutamine synthetase